MHPREFFWFSNTKYRLKITERETAHLRFQEDDKRNRVIACKASLPLVLILALLSHGALLWMFIIDDRSITVGNAKLAIIAAELKKREAVGAIPSSPPSDEAVARMLLSKLDDKQLAAVAKVAEQLVNGEGKSGENQQQITAGGTPDRKENEGSTIDGENEQPPPYTRSDEHAKC